MDIEQIKSKHSKALLFSLILISGLTYLLYNAVIFLKNESADSFWSNKWAGFLNLIFAVFLVVICILNIVSIYKKIRIVKYLNIASCLLVCLYYVIPDIVFSYRVIEFSKNTLDSAKAFLAHKEVITKINEAISSSIYNFVIVIIFSISLIALASYIIIKEYRRKKCSDILYAEQKNKPNWIGVFLLIVTCIFGVLYFSSEIKEVFVSPFEVITYLGATLIRQYQFANMQLCINALSIFVCVLFCILYIIAEFKEFKEFKPFQVLSGFIFGLLIILHLIINETESFLHNRPENKIQFTVDTVTLTIFFLSLIALAFIVSKLKNNKEKNVYCENKKSGPNQIKVVLYILIGVGSLIYVIIRMIERFPLTNSNTEIGLTINDLLFEIIILLFCILNTIAEFIEIKSIKYINLSGSFLFCFYQLISNFINQSSKDINANGYGVALLGFYVLIVVFMMIYVLLKERNKNRINVSAKKPNLKKFLVLQVVNACIVAVFIMYFLKSKDINYLSTYVTRFDYLFTIHLVITIAIFITYCILCVLAEYKENKTLKSIHLTGGIILGYHLIVSKIILSALEYSFSMRFYVRGSYGFMTKPAFLLAIFALIVYQTIEIILKEKNRLKLLASKNDTILQDNTH